MTNQIITLSTLIQRPLEFVWERWTQPEHIIHWNFASEDWCCPKALNELYPDGRINWRMEAKDGSFGFDFTGRYLQVEAYKRLDYILDDERRVSVQFNILSEVVELVETFEAEMENSVELQTMGWQAILDNFKKYCLID